MNIKDYDFAIQVFGIQWMERLLVNSLKTCETLDREERKISLMLP